MLFCWFLGSQWDLILLIGHHGESNPCKGRSVNVHMATGVSVAKVLVVLLLAGPDGTP